MTAMNETVTIPAGHGRAFRLARGMRATVALTEGPQVADMFAFASADTSEVLSTAHTRSCVERLTPQTGEAFHSSRRRPMLRIVEDTSPGVHDLLLSACDIDRYRLLGHEGPHRTCADNLREALAAFGLAPPYVPSPVNLFEKVALGPRGELVIEPPPAARGDRIVLEALMDILLVVSACPMDLVPTNGADLKPKPLAVSLA